NSVERKSLPEIIPTAGWAYKAIARLGGWTDSKGTGKAAWSTIWKGWFRLKERIEGFRMAAELMKM
ncbi:IS4 family transposase, partial [Legionella pneumophila serogroup 1]